MRFKFQAQYLPILARFAAKQDIRYYMNGIRVERAPQGLYLVATDGHCMVVIHDVQGDMVGDEHPGAIRITPAMVAAARPKRSPIPQFVILDGHRLSIAPDYDMNHGALEEFIQAGSPLVEGKYPAWRGSLPDFSALLPGALADGGSVNLNLLARFAFADKRFPGIALWRNPEADKAIIVQVHAMQEVLGIVMPMRGDLPEARRKMMVNHFPSKPSKAQTPQHVPV